MDRKSKKSSKKTVTCSACSTSYESSGHSAFCPSCRPAHESHVCEIITSDSVLTFTNPADVEKALHDMNFRSDVPIRLDLHDVLDTTEPNEKLSKHRICGLSYVGNITKTRISARLDMQERIASGQILYGVLVFKRGKDKHNPYIEIGSKAWFNTLLDNSCDPLFIDDSIDHVISVQSVGVKSVQKFDHTSLPDLLVKHGKF